MSGILRKIFSKGRRAGGGGVCLRVSKAVQSCFKNSSKLENPGFPTNALYTTHSFSIMWDTGVMWWRQCTALKKPQAWPLLSGSTTYGRISRTIEQRWRWWSRPWWQSSSSLPRIWWWWFLGSPTYRRILKHCFWWRCTDSGALIFLDCVFSNVFFSSNSGMYTT